MPDHFDDAVAAIRSILPPYLNTRIKISGYLDPATGLVGNDPTVGAPAGKMWVYGYPRGANVVVIASGGVNPRIPNVPLLVGDNHAHQAVAYGVVTDENALRQFGAGFPSVSTNPAPSETATQDTPLRLMSGGRSLPLNSTTPGLTVFIEAFPEVGWNGGNVVIGGGDIPTNPNEFRWAVFYFPAYSGTPVTPIYALTTAVTKPTKGDLLLSDAANLTLTAGVIRGGAVSLAYGQTDLTADQSRFENELRRNFVPEGVDFGTPGSGPDYILIQDQQSIGTDDGTFTSGAWRTRTLNTVVSDAGGHIVSLGSNQIVLDAGTYRASITAPAYEVNNHAAKLYDITDSADVLLGTSEVSGVTATNGATTRSIITGRFTIAASKSLEVQHQCGTTRATDGFGHAGSIQTEIYTIVELWKE